MVNRFGKQFFFSWSNGLEHFWVITVLIVWGHLCESCNCFLPPLFEENVAKVWHAFFSNKISKKYVLLQVGLQCSFGLIFFQSLQIFFLKTWSIRLFRISTRKLCVFGFPSIYMFNQYIRFIEESLEVKLPTTRTNGKAEVGRVREEKKTSEKIREKK